MKYVALLLLGLLVACGSSNSTSMDAGPDTKKMGAQAVTEDGTEGGTQTPIGAGTDIVNCGFWCDRPDFATILKRHPYYDEDGKMRALPELQLMNAIPESVGTLAKYIGDIIIDGPLYENPPPLPVPNTRLYTDGDDYLPAHIILTADFDAVANSAMDSKITGEVFAVVVDDNDITSTELILTQVGVVTPDGTFNTFEDENDQTGIEGAYFGDKDSLYNPGIVGIVGTDYFKGTFIADRTGR